jgi:hypothetical protein
VNGILIIRKQIPIYFVNNKANIPNFRKIQLPKICQELLDIPNVVIAGSKALEIVSHYKIDASDIDLFIWGVSAEEANDRVKRIQQVVYNNDYKDSRFQTGSGIHTGNAITFFNGYSAVQVVLRIYKSPAEIIHGFDIQASRVLIMKNGDEYKAWGTPSFFLSMKYSFVWTDPQRQSQTYPVRLFKYFEKGFTVALMGLDREKINMKIMKIPHRSLKGMTLILRTEMYVLDTLSRDKSSTIAGKYVRRCRGIDCTSDYSNGTGKFFNYKKFENSRGKDLNDVLASIKWMTINPSSQTVIGSFHPENESFFEGL